MNNETKITVKPAIGSATYIETIYGTSKFARTLLLDDAQSIMDLMDDFSIHNNALYQSRTSELEAERDQSNRKLTFLRDEISKIRTFVFDDTNNIGKPCQNIFEAIQEHIDELKAKNKELKEALCKILLTKHKVTNFGSSAAYREAYQIAEQALKQ